MDASEREPSSSEREPSLDERNPALDEGESSSDDLVEELTARCLALPADRRAAALEATCREHPEHARALREQLGWLGALGLDDGASESFPERLGDFRLLERLGGGGMGVVYRALQTSLGREVALKLVRPEHLYFPGARERFQREVEAIARLKHPGIVPIYTVGEDEGLPFFAMEKIDGATLADVLQLLHGRAPESLDGADLASALARATRGSIEVDRESFAGAWTDQCARLAAEIAEALAHAHQRGILHRDVKPSNVALSASGRALLLDFGLTSSGGDDRLTRTGSQVGTLHYMSPEQTRGEEATSASDVYSLGATLYELVTLRAPFGGEHRAAIEQAIRRGDAAPVARENRRARGDLAVVIGKAIAVDPRDRYASAAAFARDLRNVIDKRPIAARPPSAAIRAARFVQRNPMLSTAIGLAAALLVGGPTVLWIQQREHTARALHDAERHAQVVDYLVELFDAVDPDKAAGKELSAREILQRGRERLATSLVDQPMTRASMLLTLGRVYIKLGDHTAAHEMLVECVQALRATPNQEHVGLVETLHELTFVLDRMGDHEAAEARAREALEVAERHLGAGSPEAGRSRCMIARSVGRRGAIDQALELAEQGLAIQRAGGATPDYMIESVALLGTLSLDRARTSPKRDDRDLARAAALTREAYDMSLAVDGGVTVSTAEIAMAHGLALKLLGRLDEAESYYGKALEHFRTVLGENDHRTAACYVNLAGLHEARSQFDQAAPLQRKAADVFAKAFPPDHPYVVVARGNLASSLFHGLRRREAKAIYDELIPLQRAVHGDRSPVVATAHWNLGVCCLERAELDDAKAHLTEALAIFEGVYGASSKHALHVRADLAAACLDGNDVAGASAVLAPASKAALSGSADLGNAETWIRVRAARIELARGERDERELERLIDELERGEATANAVAEVRAAVARLVYERGEHERALALVEPRLHDHGERANDGAMLCRSCARWTIDALRASSHDERANAIERELRALDEVDH